MNIQKYSKRIFVRNVRIICVQKICFYATTNMENEYSKYSKRIFVLNVRFICVQKMCCFVTTTEFQCGFSVR